MFKFPDSSIENVWYFKFVINKYNSCNVTFILNKYENLTLYISSSIEEALENEDIGLESLKTSTIIYDNRHNYIETSGEININLLQWFMQILKNTTINTETIEFAINFYGKS